MPIVFYRYISAPEEVKQVLSERRVQSRNADTNYATFYTTTRYDDHREAQKELAMKYRPTHRVGPIQADEIPDLDISFRTVAPKNGRPGLGVEARTKSPVWLLGLWNFACKRWEL